jgi:hypothetical protein
VHSSLAGEKQVVALWLQFPGLIGFASHRFQENDNLPRSKINIGKSHRHLGAQALQLETKHRVSVAISALYRLCGHSLSQ